MNVSKNLFITAIFTAFITACVTVNIYFPAAEVQKAAEEIARDVRKNAEEQAPGQQSWFNINLNLVAVANAQESALTVSNATIRQLKAAMKARFPKLRPFMERGVIGESFDGMLVIKDASSLNLRERAIVKRLVEAENRDRKSLYNAVASALHVPASEIHRVQQIFAKEWQKTAPKGTWIEVSPGKWQRK